MSRRVLLIRFSSLGDVILTEPLVRGLRHPGSPAGTVLLTRERFAGLFRAHPDLHAVWTLEESPGVRQLRARATAGGFDEVIDLHRSLRSRALTAALDIPVRRFRTHRLRRAMLAARQPLKRRMPVPPVTDRYMEAAGIDPPAGAGRWPALRLPEEVLEGGMGVVALLPGARHAPKRWPPRHMAELASRLGKRGWRPIVLPPPDDPGTSRALRAAAPDLEQVGGWERPEMLAGLLAACSGAVCNDSGPMHLAAAVGIPVVGLFGPTSPELGFAPMGERAAFLHLGLYCSPCSRHGARPCYRERRFCMEDLTPERVLGALEGLML